MADSLTIVSVSPSSGIISTATGGATVQFVPEQVTSSTVKWQLTSGGSTVHTEDVSSVVNKTGSSWRVQCALANYLTAGTEYTLSLQAYRTGQSGTWVDALTFTAYDNPSVTITTPTSGGTVTGMPIAIAWTASDTTGIAYQNVQLWQSDEYDAPIDILYNSDQDPAFDQDTRALALGQGDLYKAIENNARYLVMVDAYNGVGLITGVQHAFTTSWQPPVTPTATVTTDPDTLAASVTVTGDRSYTFTDVESFTAPESGLITSLTVDGKSVQDGTPTPSAPVEIRSVEGGNLSPFFSHDLTDLYNGSTNPNAYWRSIQAGGYFTQLTDGWAHFEATGITATTNYYFQTNNGLHPSWLKANTKYTFLFELRNVSLAGGSYAQHYASTGTNAAIPASSSGGWTQSTVQSVYRMSVTTGNDVTSQPYLANSCIQMRGTAASPQTLSLDLRVSVYEGEYDGPYTPVGLIRLNAGSNHTDLDLQGHALRSLPDGTHDELTVDSAGVVTLTQRVGVYTFDGTETLQPNTARGNNVFYYTIAGVVRDELVRCNRFEAVVLNSINNTVGMVGLGNNSVNFSFPSTVTSAALAQTWLSSNSTTVLYKLSTPQTISLGTITPPFVAEGATVAIDAAVTPTFDATMRAAQSAGTPLTDTLMVVRVLPDGTRYVIADDLASGDTVTDRLPPIGVEFSYEVIGVAATGVPSVPTVEDVTIESRSWAFNFGTNASECLLLAGNPRETYSLKQGGELYHFAGRQLPEWYGTQERDISGLTTFDTVLWHDADTMQDLCMRHHHGWYRDPFGHRYRAHMAPKVSHGVGEVWQLSIDWDVVEWQEAK